MKIKVSIILLSTVLVTGCFHEKELDPNANGKALFDFYCAGCHKEKGQGSFLAGVPSNSTTKLRKQEIISLILYGSDEYKMMPHIQDISSEQAGKIAQYLLTLNPNY